jgi:SAM-dependent methyltransferase
LKAILKSRILKIYNPAMLRIKHLGGWLQAGYSRQWSGCEVCGRFGPKRFQPQAVPETLLEMWQFPESHKRRLRQKESMICPWCGSKSRGRLLAKTLLEQIRQLQNLENSCSCIKCLRQRDLPQILILNWIDGLSDLLSSHVSVIQTEFIDGAKPGQWVEGVRHEDAQNLSFPDHLFDLVVSSETLEHIPNLDQALAEIHRVLKPDGVHLFTVPLKPGTKKTEMRLQLTPDGLMTDLILPRLHHPGGSWGWPVVTEFGEDLPEYLADQGWLTKVITSQKDAAGRNWIDDECPVFCCTKRK